MDETRYTIQDLCDRTGLPRRTIHFYTGQELLPPPVGAGPGAYYTEDHLTRLRLIPLLRRQGLRLDEIRQKFKMLSSEECARLLVGLENGPAVTYTYDPADRLTSALYGNALTQISYDIAGRKLTLNDPDMGLWSYAYDALGNLTRQNDARGQRICLYYDGLNRLSGKHYRSDDACPASPTYNVSYGYDAGTYGKLQRTSMTDGSGITAWTYTTRGLLETETKSITGAGTFATKYTYNSADLPTNMQYPADNAGNLTALPSLTYTYHPQMALDTLGSYVTGATYDAVGRITSRSLGNGTAISNTYNPWSVQGGRLSNLTSVQSGTTRQNLSYTYDSVGNITQIEDALGLTTTYTYDGLNRLDGSSETTQNNPEYDTGSGNLLNLNGTNPATQYGYNDVEHLHAVTHIGGALKYVYDANGNMTHRPTQTLQYNAENQLTSITGNVNATFVYDGDGNRVLTTVGTTTTAYIGNHTEWNVTTQEMTRYYLAGGQRVAFRVIKSGQTDKVYYLLADHLGSSNVVMEVGGGVETKTYTAWGKGRSGGITKTDRQYTGQINEAELGLYFYNARYYDPDLGRFISADTIIPQPENPIDWDRYGYVRNSPINYTDPSGNKPCDGQLSGIDECSQVTKNDLLRLMKWLYGWSAIGRYTIFELDSIVTAGEKIAGYITESTGEWGQGWVRTHLGNAEFHQGIIPNIGAGALGAIAFVFPISDVLIGKNGFNSTDIIHELGHVLDNNEAGGLATFFGGGPADEMVQAMGGNPTACVPRFLCMYNEPIEIPIIGPVPIIKLHDKTWYLHNIAGESQWYGDAYANTGVAEDFAETFTGTILHSNIVPSGRRQWMVGYLDSLSP